MANIKVDDPRDIQGAHEDRFNDLRQAEQTPNQASIDAGTDQAEAFANDPANASQKVREQEEGGAGNDASWNNNYSGNQQSQSSTRSKALKFAKKGGPFALIISLLLGGASIVSFFGGAGMLIVNFAEILQQKFDYQVANLDVRNEKIIRAKLTSTTDGCTKLSFKCKYSTFSQKEIDNFKKAGIEPKNAQKTITGRYKVSALVFNGEEINAKNFSSTMKANAQFANAMRGAYNMKFLSKWDATWGKIEKKFGISKKAPFDENSTDEERAKKMKEDTKNGRTDTKSTTSCADPQKCTDQENKDKANSDKATEQANSMAESGERSDGNASKLANEIDASNVDDLVDDINSGGGVGSKLASAIKITGPVDDACMVVNWARTASGVAKALRSVQMARYAMIFLTTASMIKAGTAQPEDVAFLGTILTTTVKDSTGNVSKSATESFGYRYAAFGDTGIDSKASLAVAGGSFGGKIQSALNKVYDFIGRNNIRSTCKFLANPFVQAGSIAIGVIGFFFGVSEAKVLISAGISVAIAVAGGFLAVYLGEAMAGDLIKDTTYGEESGNYATSGTSGLLSQSANYGGGSILHKSQATAVLEQNREVAASYAAYDRSVLSPFDMSSPNTFMGSIFTSFAPYLYSGSNTPLALLQNLGSIVTSSAKNYISPSVSAADIKSIDECKDLDYEDMDIAADPLCNLIIGIPPQYTDIDPIAAQQSLQDSGFVDEQGTPIPGGDFAGTGMSYPGFISQCMERESPYGAGDVEGDETAQCFIDSQTKANAYIHYVDMRIGGITDDSPAATTGTDLTGTDGSAVVTPPGESKDLPTFCTDGSISATDLAQIACKAYQFDEYSYQYGAAHGANPATFMADFKAGKLSKGEPGILDCSSLVRMSIYDAFGLDVGDIATSGMESNSHFTRIPMSEAKAGDVVVAPGSHTAVVMSNDPANQKLYTFDAFGDEGIPQADQIKATTYNYSRFELALRVVK